MWVQGAFFSGLGRALFALGVPAALFGGFILFVGLSVHLDSANAWAGWGLLTIGVILMTIGIGLGLWRDFRRRR